MTEVTIRTPDSLGILKAGSGFSPSVRRRLSLVELVIRGALLRRWFARHFRIRSEADLSKIPIYPGA